MRIGMLRLGIRAWSRSILLFALAAVPLSMAAGCRPAVVRVPVSIEDISRSNSVALEGDVAFARRDYYAGLIKYLEAGRLNPNNHIIYNKIGIAYSRLGFFNESFAAFTRSITLNPKYAYSYNNMGSVYFASDNKKKAEEYFKKAIALKNDEASFHINLGTLYFEKKKFEKGLLEWRKGLSLDPEILKKSEGVGLVAASSQKNSPEKSYFMARLYASAGNVDRAVESLQQALKEGFTNLQALLTEHDFDPIRQEEKFLAFMKYATQLLKS
jgi:tetratricopeptide (TPR) repeat protein